MSRRTKRPAPAATDGISPKAPCPCGSGRRYKSCHGAGDVLVARPFEHLAGEGDWIALRELVPSATAPLRLTGEHADREVVLATVLPLALPAIVRSDGRVLLGLQVHARSGDVSRDLAHALERALAAEPGTMVSGDGLPGPGARLQDLLDTDVPLAPQLHDDFGFWLQEDADRTAEVEASLERANAAVVPTARLTGVEAAYWCRISDRAHLRWVVPYDEDPLLDALARLGAAGSLSLGDGTRYAGSFRAHGRLAPVWDLPVDSGPDEWEEPAAAFQTRLAEAMADDAPLTPDQRRSRDTLRARQLTIR